MIDRYQWMDLQDVLHATSAMDKNRVSEVARGIKDSTQTKEGFVQAYIATKGDKNKMSKRKTGRKKKGIEVETWSDRRNQFISRHLKQMRQSDTYSDGWLPNGEPTDRHLGLIAWAYTPSPKRTKKWLESQPKQWKQYVSNPSKISKQELIEFRRKQKLLKKHKESLGIKKYNGDLHNNDHQTGFFEGYIDPKKAVDIFGFNQEHNKWDFKKGSCRGKGRYTQERWEELVNDVRENGIKNPIQIVVEYTKSLGIYQPFIWEGNHRARLACQLNIPLPVEVKYFGKAESVPVYMDHLLEHISKDPIISKEIRSAIHLINKDGVNEKIGYVTFSDSVFGLKIETDIANLPDGEHGFHIHEYGNLEPKLKDGNWVAGLSAGMHYDPHNTDRHGSPYNTRYDTHLGDLPFITVKNGITRQVLYAPRLKLNEIIDRSIIIHELGDNYSDFPLPNGGGKSRIAGGVITNNCIYCNIKNNPFNAKALERILYQSYKRGVGAWKSGHRKFQSPQSWGNARVNSFLVGGRTFFSSDHDLAMKLPKDLYNAIVKQRVDVPIPKYDEKVVRDYKGNLIQEKYLDGYKGKAREKRIKEINQRRKEYEEIMKKYKTESKIPIRIKQKLYRGWETDKGESKKKSPYTKVAHKRGFTGSRMNKAKQALKYYLEPIKNPMTKEQFINQKIKWKRGKDFEFDGTYIATIDGKEYDLYRDNTSGISSYPTWQGDVKTNKILGYDRQEILGYTKKEAVKKLLTDIWNKKKSEDHLKEPIVFSKQETIIIENLKNRFSSIFRKSQGIHPSSVQKIDYKAIYEEIKDDLPDDWEKGTDETKTRTVQRLIYDLLYDRDTRGYEDIVKDINDIIFKLQEIAVQQKHDDTEDEDLTLVSQATIQKLRDAVSKIKKIDPSSPTYKKLVAFTKEQKPFALLQVYGADIKFISKIAENKLWSERRSIFDYMSQLFPVSKNLIPLFIHEKNADFTIIEIAPIYSTDPVYETFVERKYDYLIFQTDITKVVGRQRKKSRGYRLFRIINPLFMTPVSQNKTKSLITKEMNSLVIDSLIKGTRKFMSEATSYYENKRLVYTTTDHSSWNIDFGTLGRSKDDPIAVNSYLREQIVVQIWFDKIIISHNDTYNQTFKTIIEYNLQDLRLIKDEYSFSVYLKDKTPEDVLEKLKRMK